MINPNRVVACKDLYTVKIINESLGYRVYSLTSESGHSLCGYIAKSRCSRVKVGDNVRVYMKFYITSDCYKLVNLRRVLK
jgi:hypothetical protein